uniref:UDENN domain-containing protein n=1 Tax=Mesocestoides corti TaxID=53468 RepID=A0A5K3FFI6_MESCO
CLLAGVKWTNKYYDQNLVIVFFPIHSLWSSFKIIILKTMHPVAEYFFVAGLNPEIQLQPHFSQTRQPSDSPSQIVQSAYKCHILQHFPEHRHSFPFSEESTALVVMPNGLRFFTDAHPLMQKARAPFRHAFIITREDGQRVFGYAILFPEEVTHPGVKATLREQQRLVEAGSTANRFFTMKAIGILSRWAFTSGFFGWLEDLWSGTYNHGELALESYVYNLLFESRLCDPGKCSVVCGPSTQHYFFRPANFHVSPEVSNTRDGGVEADRKGSGMSWLPVFEYPLVHLLQLFPFEHFLRLLTCAFLEHRIVLLSADYYRLMVVGEGIICLLQPFVWPHVYAPVLPATLTHFLDAPVPYIMGMRLQQPPPPPPPSASVSATTLRDSLASLTAFPSFGLASEANVCYVDIDQGKVHSMDVDLPAFPNSTELRQAIEEAVLSHHRRQQMFAQPPGQSLSANFIATPLSSVPHRQSVSRTRSSNSAHVRLGSDASIRVPARKASECLSSSTVIKRPQLSAKPPIIQRSASYRLIEQIAVTTTASQSSLQHSFTEEAIATAPSTDASTTPSSDSEVCAASLSAEEYASMMRKIAKQVTSRQELPHYADLLKFNYAIRDIFLSHLSMIFVDFETFVVAGHNSGDTEDQASCGLQAFDKVGFLSDCPETHMSFLSAFLETQMFATFMDTRLAMGATRQAQRCTNCGMTRAAPPPAASTPHGPTTLAAGSSVSAFLARVQALKESTVNSSVAHPQPPATDRLSRRLPQHLDDTHTPSTSRERKARHIATSSLKSPLDGVQFCSAPLPHPLPSTKKPTFAISYQVDRFPLLDGSLLSKSPANRHPRGDSPPTGAALAVPSPFLPDVEGEQQASALGDDAIKAVTCEHCSAPQTLPIPVIDQTSAPTQSTSSRTIQLKGRDGLTRLLTGPPSGTHEASSQSPSMAQAHWDFVDALLEECKHRTKRMVIQKMGQEALHLGHNYQSVSEVEENTLVSGLCDLLERIWSHGLQKKHGASALWVHLMAFVDRNSTLSPEGVHQTAQSPASLSTRPPASPAASGRIARSASTASTAPPPNPEYSQLTPTNYASIPRRSAGPTERRISQTVTRSSSVVPSVAVQRSPAVARMRQLWGSGQRRASTPGRAEPSTTSTPTTPRAADGALVVSVASLLDAGGNSVASLLDDVEAVRTVASTAGYKLRTNIGLARAFVRLALEKKRLSAYLKLLLSDAVLLRELYLRHAFLRCEEEREQFLIHLLSLDAVDYYSFTRMLQKAELLYRVAVVSAGRGRLLVSSSANAWFCLRGHLGSSGVVALPRSSPSYLEFQHQNLGILNTLLIGHDNAGFSPNMFIEAVLVVTPLTNHVYLFPCGHWLGRGVEDNSCERLLIGQVARVTNEGTVVVSRSGEGAAIENEEAASSLSAPLMKLYADTILDPVTSAVLDRLANAVNRLAKHFACAGKAEATMSLSALLCGTESGLVPALEAVFTHGIRSSGMFQRRRLYAWDFFERFVEYNTRNPPGDQACPPQELKADAEVRIGGFSVSFVTSPRVVRTLPRSGNTASAVVATASTAGPHNLDNWRRGGGTRTGPPTLPRRAPLLTATTSSSSPAVRRTSSGWQSQPCSPGAVLKQRRDRSRSQAASTILVLENFIAAFNHVNSSGAGVGKLGKFQRMVCIGCRDHTLAAWIPVLATSSPSVVRQIYDTRVPNFLLDAELRQSVQTLLSTLNDFTFKLDPALLGLCPETESTGPVE